MGGRTGEAAGGGGDGPRGTLGPGAARQPRAAGPKAAVRGVGPTLSFPPPSLPSGAWRS